MQAELQHNAQTHGEFYAAVDLGSNSFHMVVVHVVNGSVQIIGKVKQKVRLAAGLNDKMELDEVSMERGWQCLQLFSERLQDVPSSNIKVVATATLRLATNSHVFVKRAEEILKHKLEESRNWTGVIKRYENGIIYLEVEKKELEIHS